MGLGDIGAGLGNAIGGFVGLLGGYGDGGEEELEEILRRWQGLETPTYDTRDIPAPHLTVTGRKTPIGYDPRFVRDEAALAEDSPGARRSLDDTLRYFETVRDEGMPLAEELQVRGLQRRLAGEHRRQLEGGLESLARRGRLGGGDEMAMRLAAQQGSADLNRDLSEMMTREAVLNRFRGGEAAAGLGSALRGQDIGLSQARSDALNRYNEWASNLMTQAARDFAGSRERSQDYNVETGQRVADANQLNRYGAATRNQEYGNQMASQDFDNRFRRTAGETGALGSLADAGYAEQAARRSNVTGLFGGLGRMAGGVAEVAGTGGASAALPEGDAGELEAYRRLYGGR